MAGELDAAVVGLMGAVVGGAISSGTTWFISLGERKKFVRERIWDLRRETYTKIVGSIDHATALAVHISDQYDDDPEAYDASDQCKKAHEQFVQSFDDAQTTFRANRLIVSLKFASQFDEMMTDMRNILSNPNLAPPEYADETATVLRSHNPAMLAIASREVEG